MSLLDVRDLSVSYATREGSTRVVDRISFSIDRGEVLAVVGESGSGKSTTAHALIGLLAQNGTIDSGEVLLNGTDIAGWSPKRLEAVRGAQIGLVPQDPSSSLNPVKTVGAQVGEVLRIHKRGDRRSIQRRVIELLARVGLSDTERRAGQYPHELSGGMRQRVLIAIAIALEPQLIIADEPTSALDVTVQRRILDLLDDLRAEFGTAILFITHDLGVAADRSDNLVVMQGGRIAERGATTEILERPQSDYTRTLLSDAPALTLAEFRPSLPARDSAASLAIEAHNLVKTFAGKGRGATPIVAVDSVSFQVERGTTHSIVGESGSGKTTTARMIMLFEKPTSGSVSIDGQDVVALSGEALRQHRLRVQMVYQNPFGSLDPRQSIADIVAEPLGNFGMGTRGERASRAAELIERVALPASTLGRKPRELSGGQRQRVAIARALAVHPEILVLDEAVSALDVTVQAQILELLAELQRDLGLSYLFISHDLAVVRQISDAVTVMSNGRVVESGPTRQIFESPATDYTRELLDAVPGRRATAAASAPTSSVPSTPLAPPAGARPLMGPL